MTSEATPRWVLQAKLESSFEVDVDVVTFFEDMGERGYWTFTMPDGYQPWERPAVVMTELLGEDGPDHYPTLPGVTARPDWPEAWELPWTEADYSRLVEALPWVEPRSETPEVDALRASPTAYDQPLF